LDSVREFERKHQIINHFDGFSRLSFEAAAIDRRAVFESDLRGRFFQPHGVEPPFAVRTDEAPRFRFAIRAQLVVFQRFEAGFPSSQKRIEDPPVQDELNRKTRRWLMSIP